MAIGECIGKYVFCMPDVWVPGSGTLYVGKCYVYSTAGGGVGNQITPQGPSGGEGGNLPSPPLPPPTDCETFVNLIVSAVEYRRDWTAAKSRIGAYFAVQTHRYFGMGSSVVNGFRGALTAGGQNSDVYRHVTFGIASIMLDGIGLASGADSLLRQDLGLTAGGTPEARAASKEGNRSGENIGGLIGLRISGGMTAVNLRDGIKKILCD